MQYVTLVAVAALLSYISVPWMLRLARRFNFYDHANERKIHTGIKPYLGGGALFISFAVTSVIFLSGQPHFWLILGGGAFYFTLGLLDDRINLPAKFKLILELVFTTFLVWLSMRAGLLLENPFGSIGTSPFLMALSLPFSVLWIVGIANAINLMDGLDAMASGVVLIAAIVLSLAAIISPVISLSPFLLVLVGSLTGYIRFNMYPAKIFMGDSGALFLGYAIAIISLSSFVDPERSIFLSLIPPVMALFVPLFDTCMAIVRRYLNGRKIMAPDKGHFHHCLLNRGHTHPKAVRIVWLVSAGFGGISLLLSQLIFRQIYLALALLAVTLAWAVYSAINFGLFGKAPTKQPQHQQEAAATKEQHKKAQ